MLFPLVRTWLVIQSAVIELSLSYFLEIISLLDLKSPS